MRILYDVYIKNDGQHTISFKGSLKLNISTLAQSLGNIGNEHLVGLTRVLNKDANPGLVDLFMDSARGRGHRIVHGHDFTDLLTVYVYDKFGMAGIPDYFRHLSKDVMSTDGIPFPFANEIQKLLGLSTKETIDWLCINIGDVLSGSFSVWHTKETLLALQSGNVSEELILKILIGSGIKVFFSLNNPNPISLACGVVDFGALAYYAYPFYSNYVLAILQPEITWGEILKNTSQATGVGFATSFVFESLIKIQKLLNNEISLKNYITSTTKKAVVDGLVSGCSSFVADLSDKYLNATDPEKFLVAATTFTSLKFALNKIKNPKIIKSQDSIVNLKMIPNFSF
jgi:hypothetical protein